MSSCWFLTNRKHQSKTMSAPCCSVTKLFLMGTYTKLTARCEQTKGFVISYTIACYSLTDVTHLLHIHTHTSLTGWPA